MTSQKLQAASAKLTQWMISAALPLWSTAGVDRVHGGACESLKPDGTPNNEASKRVRVQARQMFAFALASHAGWMDNGPAAVANIKEFLQRTAIHPEHPSIYVHRLSADNQLLDARRDIYDMAFFLLAAAWRYRAFGDQEALQQAEAILDHIDTHFKTCHGGWLEGDYDAPLRRQNPHMHLFEAFLALYNATTDSKWLARAGELFTLFETRFYDSRHQVLLEYFDENWQPVATEGRLVVEPGHMMEWVWLLHSYAELSGAPATHCARQLYERALEIGVDSASGLLFDEVTVEGEVIKASKRCWPITELIKANIAMARAGYRECENRAAEAIDLLFKYYLSQPVAGTYADQRGADNQLIDETAQASTLYHLILATSEVASYCKANS